MAHGPALQPTPADAESLGGRGWPAFLLCLIVGTACLGLALLMAIFFDDGWRRFSFAYLLSYVFVLTITVGSLAIVILTHLFKAGWVVTVRRVPETIAANFPTVAVLSLPILLVVLLSNGTLYPWAQPLDQLEALLHHDTPAAEHDDHATAERASARVELAAHPDGTRAEARSATLPKGVIHHIAPETPEATPDADGHVPSGVHPDTVGEAPGHGDMRPGEVPAHSFQPDTLTKPGVQPHGAHAADEHHDPAATMAYFAVHKRIWLNPLFFTLRMVVYLGVYCLIALWYYRQSVAQDHDADATRSLRREAFSPPAVIAFAFATTFMAFDLVMSLDPVWYSTIFGVYFFAGSMLSALAVTILTYMGLQSLGLVPSVTTEHYHDLGKLLFAFVFFWGYIAFSQYMLIWYASLPETTYWFALRGATTVSTEATFKSPWTALAIMLLFGHLFIPFAFLLSKHIKRNRFTLGLAAVWLLVMHYIDHFWLIMPVFGGGEHGGWARSLPFGPMEILCLLGLIALTAAGVIRLLSRAALMPVNDPRIGESLAFRNL